MTTSEEWSPVGIEARLKTIANDNAHLIGLAHDTHRDYLTEAHAYDLAYARAYMRCTGPAHERRYYAEIQTEEERTIMDAADVAHRHVERQLRGKRDELDAIRSVGVSVRQAYATGGGDS